MGNNDGRENGRCKVLEGCCSRCSPCDTVLYHTVENNCGYHLFESDSEEEEEEDPEKKEEEPPKKKSAFQVC